MRFDRTNVFLVGVVVLVFGGAVMSVLAGESETKETKETKAPATAQASHHAAAATDQDLGEGASCLADKSVIDDLNRRKQDLDTRQKELASKEQELKEREKALDEEMKKLDQTRDDISKIDATKKKDNEEKLARLVDTFESMSPKSAAQIISSLDETLAVATISKMSTPKLAKIMNLMEPARSSRLSEILAGVARAKVSLAQKAGRGTASSDAGGNTSSSTRGGDRNDGHQQQRSSSQSDPSEKREPSGLKKGAGES